MHTTFDFVQNYNKVEIFRTQGTCDMQTLKKGFDGCL